MLRRFGVGSLVAGMMVAAAAVPAFAQSAPARAATAESAPAAPTAPTTAMANTAELRCDAAFTAPDRATGFHHFGNSMRSHLHGAKHRGMDAFVREGAPQIVSAKFAYGMTDHDLKGEDVDVYVLRNCNRWERLGSTRTTGNGEPATLSDGTVATDGGRASFRIPDDHRLGRGLHRVRFVVRGDHSTADAMVDVVAPGARYVVSDVDGTLTQSENAEVWHTLHVGGDPNANPGAAETLTALAHQGYRVVYLTGRPGWVAPRTRTWLSSHGFPTGVLITQRHLGFNPERTTAYKIAELQAMTRTVGHAPDYAFGNTQIDVAAYRAAGVQPEHRFFYRFVGDTAGGRAHSDYRELAARFTQTPRAVAATGRANPARAL